MNTDYLKYAGVTDLNDLKDFAIKLMNSGCSSIDSFVYNRSEYLDIAKLAVSGIIGFIEDYEKLFNPDTEQNWYQLLFNLLVGSSTKAAEIGFERVSIFTFNYDRSLEAYFLKALETRFKLNPLEAAKHFERLQIRHAYGALGSIRPYMEDGFDYGDADLSKRMNLLRIASKRILLTPEMRGDDTQFKWAREKLQESSRLCFLGYGFDELNDKRLGFRDVIDHRKTINDQRIKEGRRQLEDWTAWATVIGMTKLEVARAKSRLLGEHCELTSLNMDCRMAIREAGIL